MIGSDLEIKKKGGEKVQYPKPIMSITELTELGFCRDYLKAACHAEGQNFATKTVGGGKFQIDTKKFEEWREACLEREQAKTKYTRRKNFITPSGM